MARPRSDISPRIIKAARARFLKEGVDGAALRAIAKDAGTSIGMVYYYFPTKDDLFFAVVEDVYAVVLADVEQALAPGDSMNVRVERFYARLSRLSAEEFSVIQVIVREALVSSERLDRLIERFSRGHLPLLVNTVLGGMQSGEFRTDLHPFAMIASLLSLGLMPQIVHKLAAARLSQHFPAILPPPDDLAQMTRSVLFDGLKKR